MCKLLFFDTESGNGHTGSMCSFGYVLTDEKTKNLFSLKDEVK